MKLTCQIFSLFSLLSTILIYFATSFHRTSVSSNNLLRKEKLLSTNIINEVKMSTESNNQIIYRVQHPGTCSGMFWRDDPRPGAASKASSKPDWPRNGALLKGMSI